MDRWVGRVVLVTGASSGIGAALCEILVRSGLKVIGAARRVENVKSLAEKLTGAKGSLFGVKCDLTKEEDIRSMFEEIKSKFGGLDICINNAGLSNGKGILNSTVEEMQEMTNVNIIALCLCSQLAIKSMRERGVDDGHIININSVAGHVVIPRVAKFYTATKYAVTALTEGLRQEMREAKSHIRITSISPGLVESQFAYKHKDEVKARQIYASLECLQPMDIANAIIPVITAPKHVEINELTIRPTEQPF